eukprot:TRINITY_DN8348_c0_g1_i5.p1 TRINITY_DN8348_c0_g1~~TRINITY_DN8348_c0_g1_i5.p1  ORF type:complete len:108 (+),score=15.82 TRINITY_DN8348_c0_g1_i5:59-382(+)
MNRKKRQTYPRMPSTPDRRCVSLVHLDGDDVATAAQINARGLWGAVKVKDAQMALSLCNELTDPHHRLSALRCELHMELTPPLLHQWIFALSLEISALIALVIALIR